MCYTILYIYYIYYIYTYIHIYVAHYYLQSAFLFLFLCFFVVVVVVVVFFHRDDPHVSFCGNFVLDERFLRDSNSSCTSGARAYSLEQWDKDGTGRHGRTWRKRIQPWVCGATWCVYNSSVDILWASCSFFRGASVYVLGHIKFRRLSQVAQPQDPTVVRSKNAMALWQDGLAVDCVVRFISFGTIRFWYKERVTCFNEPRSHQMGCDK